jgi:hypothetical protein
MNGGPPYLLVCPSLSRFASTAGSSLVRPPGRFIDGTIWNRGTQTICEGVVELSFPLIHRLPSLTQSFPEIRFHDSLLPQQSLLFSLCKDAVCCSLASQASSIWSLRLRSDGFSLSGLFLDRIKGKGQAVETISQRGMDSGQK